MLKKRLSVRTALYTFLNDLLMVMMLMLFCHFGEFLSTDLFIFWFYLSGCPFEYLLSLQTVISIFYKLSILHHFLYIVGNPWLIIAKVSPTHVTEQLLFGKILYL